MQEKHVVVFRGNEDRDIYINKIKYPKTVYQINGVGEPEKDDIVTDSRQSTDWILAQHIVDSYDNLPDYTIFSQANPDDHVHEMLLAIDSTFTDDFGSFSYARSMYDQYCFNFWERLVPVEIVANELGLKFHNSNNTRKSIYYCQPGQFFYVSKKRILEKPKSFYQKIVDLDNDNRLVEKIISCEHPDFFWKELYKQNKKYRNLSKTEKLKTAFRRTKRDEIYGLALEPLWFLIFGNNDLVQKINKAQSTIGNELYFNTYSKNYDSNFSFNSYPYNLNPHKTMMNFKLLENNWFKWDCPYYLKWRKKLIEKTIWEGQQRGFNGKELLEFYKTVGYKHISL